MLHIGVEGHGPILEGRPDPGGWKFGDVSYRFEHIVVARVILDALHGHEAVFPATRGIPALDHSASADIVDCVGRVIGRPTMQDDMIVGTEVLLASALCCFRNGKVSDAMSSEFLAKALDPQAHYAPSFTFQDAEAFSVRNVGPLDAVVAEVFLGFEKQPIVFSTVERERYMKVARGYTRFGISTMPPKSRFSRAADLAFSATNLCGRHQGLRVVRAIDVRSSSLLEVSRREAAAGVVYDDTDAIGLRGSGLSFKTLRRVVAALDITWMRMFWHVTPLDGA